MSSNHSRWCVFLPCSGEEIWAVPQNCLAEVVTVQAVGQAPPEQINWRGQEVPVLDLDESGETPWRDPLSETGHIAVILGLEGQASDYWAVALRGEGLAAKNLSTREIKDQPDRVMDKCTSAFEYQDVLYQVPDLPELQKQVAMYCTSAP
jgi:chemotaxis signal transduction protein